MTTAAKSKTGYQTLVRSYERPLSAGDSSEQTIRRCLRVPRGFSALLPERGMPTIVESITRTHADERLAETLRTTDAAQNPPVRRSPGRRSSRPGRWRRPSS